MFETEFRELESELKTIAAGGTTPRPPDWRKTKILGNEGGILADARKFLQPEWWRRGESQAGASLHDIFRRFETRVSDGVAEENEYPEGRHRSLSSNEIAEPQRDREKVGQDAEAFEEYLPGPDQDVHKWLANFSKHVDINTEERRPWFSALQSYVAKFTPGTKARELDDRAVRELVRKICEGEGRESA